MKLQLIIDSHRDDQSPADSSLSASVSTDVRTAITVDVSDAGNESEADAGVSASSVSHGASDSSLSNARERMPLECDIGKLQFSGVDIKGLSREDRYRLLTTEPNPDPLSYPRTRPCQFPEVQTCLAKTSPMDALQPVL